MGALTLTPNLATWAIAGLATLGVITRPFSWPSRMVLVAGLSPEPAPISVVLSNQEKFPP